MYNVGFFQICQKFSNLDLKFLKDDVKDKLLN